MNYTQALQWVHGLPRLGPQPGLGRMQKLVNALGNPQGALPFVHVAGTNGKGSTVAMLSNILNKAGYKTGANISPYVIDFRERFLIDGQMIAEERLAQILTTVYEAAQTLAEPIIEFEAVTAAALLYFAREKCDIACIEAGIGGSKDATNVIQNTLVACLTKIGFDHTELLGSTLQKIAEDKCGIIKKGCIAVAYPQQPPEACREIERQAAARGCPLVVPPMEQLQWNKAGKKSFAPLTVQYRRYKFTLPFVGEHQALNASVVVEAALALRQKGFVIQDEDIIKGIETARFPARIEYFSGAGRPDVILDCAHNQDSAQALADTLEKTGYKNMVAVLGILQDKQAEEMLGLLSPYIKEVYIVAPPSPRAIAAEKLARQAAPYFEDGAVHPCSDMQSAYTAAMQAATRRGSSVLICGSVYLAAQARELII